MYPMMNWGGGWGMPQMYGGGGYNGMQWPQMMQQMQGMRGFDPGFMQQGGGNLSYGYNPNSGQQALNAAAGGQTMDLMGTQGPTGAQRDGMGWRQTRRQEQRVAGNQNARMDRMQDQMHRLSEQYKGAGSTQQGGLQNRMDALQQRMTGLQGRMGDPNAEGANRAGMGWRQERRQAKNQAAAGAYNPAAAAPQTQQAQAPQQAPGGAPQFGAGSPWNYDQNAGTVSFTGGSSFFNSSFGELTTASGGDSRIFKQTGGGEGPNDRLYHFDPSAGWKSMTGSEYRGYGDYNYADPPQYMNDPRVGAQKHSFRLLGR